MFRAKDIQTSILACMYASLMFTGLPRHFPLLTICFIHLFHLCVCLFYYQGEYQAALDIYDEEVK